MIPTFDAVTMRILCLLVLGLCLEISLTRAASLVEKGNDRSADVAEDIAGGAEDDAMLNAAAANEVSPVDAESTDENDAALSLDRYYANLPDDFIFGHCSVQPNPAKQNLTDFLWGSIDLRQSLKGGPTEIRIDVTGFDKFNNYTLHGFHVHEFGDLSAGCESAGGHYDPFGVVHGGPEDDPRFRHFGDLGNVNENDNGEVTELKKDYLVSLLGPFSVLGRAVVIHETEDDLGRGQDEGSLLSGNAGIRLGCCTIGLSNGERWQDKAWDARWKTIEEKQAENEAGNSYGKQSYYDKQQTEKVGENDVNGMES